MKCTYAFIGVYYGISRGGGKDMPAVERIAAIHWVMEAPLELLTRFLYPVLYPVHDLASGPWGISDQEGRIQVWWE